MTQIELSKEKVIKFFEAKDEEGKISTFIRKLDTTDNWAADYDNAEHCNDLIDDIEGLFEKYGNVLHSYPDSVLYVLSNIVSSRCLYLIDLISENYPLLFDAIARKIDEYEFENDLKENKPPNIVKQRFDVVERAKLLNAIYNSEVYARIFKVLKR